MRFSELFILLLEKGLVRNGFGLKFYLENYNNAIDEEIEEEKQVQEITTDLRQMKKMQEQAKELVPGKLNRFKFMNFLKKVGKLYYHGQKNPIDKYLEQILLEISQHRKKSANANTVFYRVLNYDESNKKVFNEYTIETILEYEEDLKRLFTAYMPENYDKQNIMLTWEEIDMLNKKTSTMSVLKLLIDANIMPTLITQEHYQDIQVRIVPPFNQLETLFYQQEQIKKIFEKDLGKKPITSKTDGDPYISFFEFQMIFVKIALETTPKDQIKKEKDVQDAICKFMQNVVQIRNKKQENDWDILKKSTKFSSTYIYRLFCPVQLQNKKKDTAATPQNTQANKSSNFSQTQTQQGSKQDLSNQQDGLNNQSQQKKTKLYENDDEYFDEPLKLLQAIENNLKFGEGLTSKFELDNIYKTLQTELPQIPPPYKPEKQVVDIQKYVPKVIGEQPPKPPVDKNAKKQKEEPKKKKKGEEERVIRWAGMPPPPPKTTYDHFNSYNDQLEFNNPFQINQKSGVMSHIEAAPVLLEEMIYPQNIPADAKKILEASILNYSQQNFYASLENLNTCYDTWLNVEDRSDLTIQNEIFFEFFKGMIFQSAGRDDLALSSFFSSKVLSDKLQMDYLDKALPYCGLGGILFRVEEYNLALRSFLKAREIRELSIGADNMETATIYNNLGCCMLKLNRNLEAITYFEIAYAIFDLELGQFHIRTSTVQRNLIKCKKQGVSFLPEFRTPWITYEKDPLKKSKPKGKSDKKK
ncbi:hypothetical protein ABPG72_017131 [Tetrahymena utriculariae]